MILEPIVSRRAQLSFSGEPVAQDQITNMFKAAILAPSGGNNQPWRYYYAIKGTEGFEILLACLDEGNQRWARNAGALILSAAQIRYVYKEKMFTNSHAWHDTGLANSLLMIQAETESLKTHPMGGFDRTKAAEAAGLGPDIEPVVMIAVGHPGKQEDLAADLLRKQTSPRLRKPLEEVVTEL